jgi:hypothetical protein
MNIVNLDINFERAETERKARDRMPAGLPCGEPKDSDSDLLFCRPARSMTRKAFNGAEAEARRQPGFRPQKMLPCNASVLGNQREVLRPGPCGWIFADSGDSSGKKIGVAAICLGYLFEHWRDSCRVADTEKISGPRHLGAVIKTNM